MKLLVSQMKFSGLFYNVVTVSGHVPSVILPWQLPGATRSLRIAAVSVDSRAGHCTSVSVEWVAAG
jgi:hypothetical protein